MVQALPFDALTDFYEFQIELDGEVLIYRARFNTRMDKWVADVLDTDGNLILTGIALLTNLPMFARYSQAGVPQGTFLVLDTSGNNTDPDRETLGENVKVFYEETT